MNDWDPARERSRARSTRPAPVTVERGCEVALADMKDAEALTAAFTGVSGVFVLIPSNFDPTPGFPEVRAWSPDTCVSLQSRLGLMAYGPRVGGE